MAIIRRVYRQGNSHVISIPAYMLRDIAVGRGSKVRIESIPGRMITVERAAVQDRVDSEAEGENAAAG
jgi:antitoxin component of MazEF toxin-antitoxin module